MAQVIELPGEPKGFRRPGGLHVPWERFIAQYREDWGPGQHPSVLGQNGSGKSWLIRHLLEACCAQRRVLLFDTKAADDLWKVGFYKETGLPGDWLAKTRRRFQQRDQRKWIRVVPPMSRAAGRAVVAGWMRWAWRQGSTVIVFDETRTIANKAPGYGLDEAAHQLWQRGRAKYISVVAGAQSPVYLPSAFYDEATAGLFIGRIKDARRLKRVEEIAGNPDELVEVVQRLGKYEFVFVPPDGDQLMVVKAPATMPGAKIAASGGWTNSQRHRLLYGD